MTSFAAQFKQIMEKEINDFGDGIDDEIRRLAVLGFETTVDRSPLWSGSYILSHRISINGTPVAPPTNVKVYAVGADGQPVGRFPMRAEQINPGLPRQYRDKARSEAQKIHTHQGPITEIEISNDIEYAIAVEAQNGAPYQVAAQMLRAMAAQIGQTSTKIAGRKKALP